MIDYPSLRAVAMVAQTGSFERAAAALNVTPSAVSQRVRNLEERLGVTLIVRGAPCTATEKGEQLCRHLERVGLLERELFAQLPGLAESEDSRQPVTIHVATNADSLATWFIRAVADFARQSGCLFGIAVDDQDHTADWLRRGRVLAAVTAMGRAVAGCRMTPLGALRYRATASPDFMARYFPDGVMAASLAHAPALTFNQKDSLQHRWIQQVLGHDVAYPTHWLPSAQSFVDAGLAGLGWGMNPASLVEDHLATGRLVELVPDTPMDVALFWQINRLAADQLAALTKDVIAVARQELLPPPVTP